MWWILAIPASVLLGLVFAYFIVRRGMANRPACDGCLGSGFQQYLGTDEKTGKDIFEWWPCEDCQGTGRK